MPKCRSCGAEIFWARTPRGNLTPVDADPDPKGILAIVEMENGEKGSFSARYAQPDNKNRYTSHFVTCPHARSWRNR